MKPVGIIGTGSYLPEKVLTNKDLENMVDTTDEWIVSRTGIRERRIAAEDQASSDLAVEASRKALEAAGVTADQLDLIIVATVTPDMMFPATACLLQDRLGAKKAAAFDLSAACSGFLYGIATASQFIQSGMYRYALVVGVDCLSKITNWEDRNTCVLFGDGAGAVVLGPVEEGSGFLSFELGADGSGGDLLKQPAGGSRLPASRDTVDETPPYHFHGRPGGLQICGPRDGQCRGRGAGQGGNDEGRHRLPRSPSGQHPHHRCRRQALWSVGGKSDHQSGPFRKHVIGIHSSGLG